MESLERIFTPQSKYDRYNRSAKGRARYKRYAERHPDRIRVSSHKYNIGRRKERYHEIQDATGCHMRVDDFYPGFLFLEALKDAEVGET